MAKEISVNNSIAIIGSGHMGSAFAAGLVHSGIQAQRITVSGPRAPRNHTLKKLGVRTTRHNTDAVHAAVFIFLAVKPAMVPSVLHEIHQVLKNKIIVSLAAGIRTATLEKNAPGAHIVRIMPNLPVAVNQGVIGYFPGKLAPLASKKLSRVLSGLGVVITVPSEDTLDALTLLSGCGPALVAFFIEALAERARSLGLSSPAADALAAHTFSGTLSYLAETTLSPKRLMHSVATKGGVTEAILADLTARGFALDFARAIAQGHARIKKLNHSPCTTE